MRRAGRFVVLLCLAAVLAFAEGKQGGDENLQMWKWANFLVLAGALGYLMVKSLPPFFVSRTAAITKDMVESQKIRQDADSREETNAEAGRLAEHTAAEIARIQRQAEREISDAGKTAQKELRRFGAELAIDFAAQKIRARMTSATEDRLVRGFVRDLK
jgi:F-type H+-transporting ATPase subunit b